jgi:hypothetical protein
LAANAGATSPPIAAGDQLMAQAHQAMFGAGAAMTAAGMAAAAGAGATGMGDVSFDPAYFIQLPPDIFNTDYVNSYDTNVASMDWTSWNEFVTDASANANNRDLHGRVL